MGNLKDIREGENLFGWVWTLEGNFESDYSIKGKGGTQERGN